MSYCLQALQLFEGMEQQRFMAALSEVAGRGASVAEARSAGQQLEAPPQDLQPAFMQPVHHIAVMAMEIDRRLPPSGCRTTQTGAERRQRMVSGRLSAHGGQPWRRDTDLADSADGCPSPAIRSCIEKEGRLHG